MEVDIAPDDVAGLETATRRGVIWLNEREGALFGIMGGWRTVVDWARLDMSSTGVFGGNVAAQLARWRWDNRLTDAERRSGASRTALDVLGVPEGLATYLGFDPGDAVDRYGREAACAALTACWRRYQPPSA